jgi:hypothetical protein
VQSLSGGIQCWLNYASSAMRGGKSVCYGHIRGTQCNLWVLLAVRVRNTSLTRTTSFAHNLANGPANPMPCRTFKPLLWHSHWLWGSKRLKTCQIVLKLVKTCMSSEQGSIRCASPNRVQANAFKANACNRILVMLLPSAFAFCLICQLPNVAFWHLDTERVRSARTVRVHRMWLYVVFMVNFY